MGTHYSHVTQPDRISIQALMQAKLNGPEIARQLSLSRSTINRSKVLPAAAATDYQTGVAQARSVQQRRAGGAAQRKLVRTWSPRCGAPS